MRIDEALKYLGGGVVVYVVMAACGSEPTSSGGKAARNDARDSGSVSATGDGSASGGGGGTQTTKEDGGIGQTLTDAMAAVRDALVGTEADALTDPVPDAMAQTCGDCTVPSTLKVVTADTDSQQADQGLVSFVGAPINKK